jgi:hypothetical protein
MDDLSAEEYKISDDMEVDVSKEKSTEKEVCIRGEENKSKWLQLMETGLVVEAHHLCSAEHCAEFACLHNCDSHNFMNVDKFERFILKKTKATVPYGWDLLDET